MVNDIRPTLHYIYFSSQLQNLESKLEENEEEKRKFRTSLSTMFPKDIEKSTILEITRKVVRLIGGDDVFQFFGIFHTVDERNFSKCYPTLFHIIISVVMHKSNCDYDKSLSAMGRHLSKCKDRKKSKNFRALMNVRNLRSGDNDISNSSCESETS